LNRFKLTIRFKNIFFKWRSNIHRITNLNTRKLMIQSLTLNQLTPNLHRLTLSHHMPLWVTLSHSRWKSLWDNPSMSNNQLTSPKESLMPSLFLKWSTLWEPVTPIMSNPPLSMCNLKLNMFHRLINPLLNTSNPHNMFNPLNMLLNHMSNPPPNISLRLKSPNLLITKSNTPNQWLMPNLPLNTNMLNHKPSIFNPNNMSNNPLSNTNNLVIHSMFNSLRLNINMSKIHKSNNSSNSDFIKLIKFNYN